MAFQAGMLDSEEVLHDVLKARNNVFIHIVMRLRWRLSRCHRRNFGPYQVVIARCCYKQPLFAVYNY